MKMKTAILTLLLTIASAAFTIADPASPDLAKRLQQGLVEEEVNRDPKAAIEHYAKLLEEFDAGRQFAATALFRTAECQRKLGDDKAAAESFSRLVRLFPEQDKLVVLARQNLTALGTPMPGAPQEAIELTAQEAEALKELRTIARDSPDLLAAGDATHLLDAVRDSHAEAVRFLLENGADPDQSKGHHINNRARTERALKLAIEKGNLRIVKLLLGAGATLAPDDLAISISNHRTSITAAILKHIEAAGTEFDFHPALESAVGMETFEIFEKLLALGAKPTGVNDRNMGLLHVAASWDKAELCKLLIEKYELPVDARSDTGITPLDIAAGGTVATIKVLLDAGADVNNISSGNYYGHSAAYLDKVTPLIRALGSGYAQKVRWSASKAGFEAILAANPKLDHADANGNTALHYAVAHHAWTNFAQEREATRTDKGNPQVSEAISALLAAGAETDVMNGKGMTPPDYARDSGLKKLLYRHKMLHGKQRATSILVEHQDRIQRPFTRTTDDQPAPTLPAAIVGAKFGAKELLIYPADKSAPKSVNLAELAAGGEIPTLGWGDLIKVESEPKSDDGREIRDFLHQQLKRTVTVKRGELEASFTIFPHLYFYPVDGGLYDPRLGVVHLEKYTAFELTRKALLITPFTSQSVAKLNRADGESLNISLMQGAKEQPELRDGDRLEIAEAEHTPDARPAITCDQRLLYWTPEIYNRDCSLADLIGSAYGGTSPFIISHPDFENINARHVAKDGTVTNSGWNFAEMIGNKEGPGFGDGEVTLNIPFFEKPEAGDEWTGLDVETVKWLEEQLAYSVSIRALDQPTRELKIGPEVFSYRYSADHAIRTAAAKDTDKRFDARGIESDRLLPNAGYADEKLYDWKKASVSKGSRGYGSAVWLPDGAEIRVKSPSPHPTSAAQEALRAHLKARSASQNKPRAPSRRVVLPPSSK